MVSGLWRKTRAGLENLFGSRSSLVDRIPENFSFHTEEHGGGKLEPVCVSPAQESFEVSEENVGDTRHAEKQTLSEQNSQICPDSMKHSSQHVGESGEDTAAALLLMGINEG